MTYAITSRCCNDASCVAVCPVNRIHPTPDEPGFATSESLHVDPRACIGCGACADACPVDAVVPLDALAEPDRTDLAEVDAAWYAQDEPVVHPWPQPRFPRPLPAGLGALRVAIVGNGPAAGYTARALLNSADVRLTVLDRLPVPGGLLRFGVAPDHPAARRLGDSFGSLLRSPRVRLHLGVEVGRQLSAAELLEHHSAVVYAVGAPDPNPLGIPGEDLPGSVPATAVVAWYNGAPDARPAGMDLSHPRAAVVGHGNVALDIARILLADPDELADTDIAPQALAALRTSGVREVVLLGRRGPEQAAFRRSELRAVLRDPDLDVVVADDPRVRDALRRPAPGSVAELLAGAPLVPSDAPAPPPAGRRLVLRFFAAPTQITGTGRVEGVRLAQEQLAAGLVVAATGSRRRPVPGLPSDPGTGALRSEHGRVLVPATGTALPGTYVVGWAKRGASGGIGANRLDAQETVEALLDDAAAGRLPAPEAGARSFDRLVDRRSASAAGRRRRPADAGVPVLR